MGRSFKSSIKKPLRKNQNCQIKNPCKLCGGGNKQTYRNKCFTSVDKETDQKFTYVAIDSCILIDFEKLCTGRYRSVERKGYKSSLVRLFDRSKITNGQINGNGAFVLMILPSVYEELSTYEGKYHDLMNKLISAKILKVGIAQKHRETFDKKVKQLMAAYEQAGLFLDNQGNLMQDARHVAEASLLNVTLLSSDNDIINERMEKIKSINKRLIQSDFNGHQAQPRKLTDFMKCIKNDVQLAQPEYVQIMDSKTKQRFNELNFPIQGPEIII